MAMDQINEEVFHKNLDAFYDTDPLREDPWVDETVKLVLNWLHGSFLRAEDVDILRAKSWLPFIAIACPPKNERARRVFDRERFTDYCKLVLVYGFITDNIVVRTTFFKDEFLTRERVMGYRPDFNYTTTQRVFMFLLRKVCKEYLRFEPLLTNRFLAEFKQFSIEGAATFMGTCVRLANRAHADKTGFELGFEANVGEYFKILRDQVSLTEEEMTDWTSEKAQGLVKRSNDLAISIQDLRNMAFVRIDMGDFGISTGEVKYVRRLEVLTKAAYQVYKERAPAAFREHLCEHANCDPVAKAILEKRFELTRPLSLQ